MASMANEFADFWEEHHLSHMKPLEIREVLEDWDDGAKIHFPENELRVVITFSDNSILNICPQVEH